METNDYKIESGSADLTNIFQSKTDSTQNKDQAKFNTRNVVEIPEPTLGSVIERSERFVLNDAGVFFGDGHDFEPAVLANWKDHQISPAKSSPDTPTESVPFDLKNEEVREDVQATSINTEPQKSRKLGLKVGISKIRNLISKSKLSESTISASTPKTLPKNTNLNRSQNVEKVESKRIEATKEEAGKSFDLDKVLERIGNYEIDASEVPQLTTEAKKALYEGCKDSTAKRTEFLTKFQEHLKKTPSADKTSNSENPVTTLSEFFGGDQALLQLYKEAVDEERNSTQFRDAVFAAAVEKQDINPCPGQRMVMYVGGPSAAGKSFTRGAFVEQVREQRNPDGINDVNAYVVSIDGGIDREMCQIRQIVLQAALAKGNAGIQDLHKNTKTSVKAKVQKAAMKQGNNMHLVIPTTFIDGFTKFISMFKNLGKKSDTYQVFAEVRADKTEPAITNDVADNSFRETILYNGESRAYYLEGDPPLSTEDIKMNNRKIPCESKVYQAKYFNFGVQFSRKAKKAFKIFASNTNSLILSNESDNMHVKLDSSGKYIQTTANPTVKHVSRRELMLWEALYNEPTADDEQLKSILKNFGLPEEKQTSMFTMLKTRPLKTNDGTEVADLKGFIKFLSENNARSKLKVTKARIK